MQTTTVESLEQIAHMLNTSGTGCKAEAMQGYVECKVPGITYGANGKPCRYYAVEQIRTEYQARKLIAAMQ